MITGSFLEDVFMSVPGTVMVFSKPMRSGYYSYFQGSYRGSVDVFANGSAYGFMRSVITNITINENCNFQFMPSLRNIAYLYTFGDKIAEIDVSGTCFLNPECDGFSGANAVYAFYYRNKLSNNPYPLRLTLMSFASMGGMAMTFSPFLASMTLSLSDPGAALGTFNYKLLYLPANDSSPLPLSTGIGSGPYRNTPNYVGGGRLPVMPTPGASTEPNMDTPIDGTGPGTTQPVTTQPVTSWLNDMLYKDYPYPGKTSGIVPESTLIEKVPGLSKAEDIRVYPKIKL